jgi:ESCRT-II complex subunit VPS36
LFGNLREIKKVMNNMKESSGQTDGDNPEVHKILKDMGFVSVISRDEAGKDYERQLARDLFQVCQGSLFKNYGGVVALLDLFYFYNKKRQLNLLSPEEVVRACELFPSLGLQAKLVRYPNNIILVESTTFDPVVDFEENYAKFFSDFKTGYSAEEIARRKGLPVAIVDIKLRNACRTGKLAVSDRI